MQFNQVNWRLAVWGYSNICVIIEKDCDETQNVFDKIIEEKTRYKTELVMLPNNKELYSFIRKNRRNIHKQHTIVIDPEEIDEKFIDMLSVMSQTRTTVIQKCFEKVNKKIDKNMLDYIIAIYENGSLNIFDCSKDRNISLEDFKTRYD
jgi:hypothetical protein